MRQFFHVAAIICLGLAVFCYVENGEVTDTAVTFFFVALLAYTFRQWTPEQVPKPLVVFYTKLSFALASINLFLVLQSYFKDGDQHLRISLWCDIAGFLGFTNPIFEWIAAITMILCVIPAILKDPSSFFDT